MVPARFTAKITVNDAGCWVWTAAVTKYGYGAFNSGPETVAAHIYAYVNTIGPVPAGLELDHLCHNRDATCPGGIACLHRRCCNPEHLEPVTHLENVRRSPRNGVGIAKAQESVRARTHCPQRHPYDDVNTGRTKAGHRYCKECSRISANRRYARLKEAKCPA